MKKGFSRFLSLVCATVLLLGLASLPASAGSYGELKEFTYATSVHFSDPEFGQRLAAQFEKDTGVKMKLIDVSNDKWEEKIAALLMSGDVPDVFRGNGNVLSYVIQEYVRPIDDLIANNPKMKEFAEKFPESHESFVIDGQTYAMTLSKPQNMSVWLRKDLLDKAGLAMPASLDEFVAALRAIKAMDINGNGQDDTIPFTMGTSTQAYEVFAAAFGTRTTIYQKDGVWIDPIVTPEYKEYLDFMKMLVSEGLFDKEFAGQSYSQTRTKVYTNLAAGITIWDNTGFAVNLRKNNVEGEVLPVPPFATEKGAFGQSFYPPSDNAYLISATCKYPQEVFDAFFEWHYFNPNGVTISSRGIEGYNFTVVDGVLTQTEKGGVGFHGQHFPPYDTGVVFPFQLDADTTEVVRIQEEIRANYKPFAEQFDTRRPPFDCTAYWENEALLSGSAGKIAELSYQYWLGTIDYDKFLSEYNAFAQEIDVAGMLDQLNTDFQ